MFPSPAADHDNDCILIIGQQDAISRAKTELEARIKDLVRLSTVVVVVGVAVVIVVVVVAAAAAEVVVVFGGLVLKHNIMLEI